MNKNINMNINIKEKFNIKILIIFLLIGLSFMLSGCIKGGYTIDIDEMVPILYLDSSYDEVTPSIEDNTKYHIIREFYSPNEYQYSVRIRTYSKEGYDDIMTFVGDDIVNHGYNTYNIDYGSFNQWEYFGDYSYVYYCVITNIDNVDCYLKAFTFETADKYVIIEMYNDAFYTNIGVDNFSILLPYELEEEETLNTSNPNLINIYSNDSYKQAEFPTVEIYSYDKEEGQTLKSLNEMTTSNFNVESYEEFYYTDEYNNTYDCSYTVYTRTTNDIEEHIIELVVDDGDKFISYVFVASGDNYLYQEIPIQSMIYSIHKNIYTEE